MIVEYLSSQKGGFFVFKAINTHPYTIDLTHDKSEEMTLSMHACPDIFLVIKLALRISFGLFHLKR